MTLVAFDSRITLQTRYLPAVAHPVAILLAAGRVVRRWQERRANARALESLPFELRKDLGWPAADRPTRLF